VRFIEAIDMIHLLDVVLPSTGSVGAFPYPSVHNTCLKQEQVASENNSTTESGSPNNGRESGCFEICVIPYSLTGERWKISASGGVQPEWRGKGEELFYLDPLGTLMAVNIRPTPRRPGTLRTVRGRVEPAGARL
jgi:hypothetical protein